MNWGDMGLLALKNALRSRQKTFFCALAVCVGIASVYMICEISRNARDQITQQVEQSGLSGIMVFGKEEQGMMAAEEIRALPQSVPGLKAAMPLFPSMAPASCGRKSAICCCGAWMSSFLPFSMSR